jgi:hypothetical protein
MKRPSQAGWGAAGALSTFCCCMCCCRPAGEFKLADFGLARIFGSPDRQLTAQVPAVALVSQQWRRGCTGSCNTADRLVPTADPLVPSADRFVPAAALVQTSCNGCHAALPLC